MHPFDAFFMYSCALTNLRNDAKKMLDRLRSVYLLSLQNDNKK